MTRPARALTLLGVLAALTLALALAGMASAGSTPSVPRLSQAGISVGAGNPCFPLHDYASAACDKAWTAYVNANAARAESSATVARPRPAAPCAPLHDYKSGPC